MYEERTSAKSGNGRRDDGKYSGDFGEYSKGLSEVRYGQVPESRAVPCMIFKSIRRSDFIEGYTCYTNTHVTLDFLFL